MDLKQAQCEHTFTVCIEIAKHSCLYSDHHEKNTCKQPSQRRFLTMCLFTDWLWRAPRCNVDLELSSLDLKTHSLTLRRIDDGKLKQ